MTKPSTVKIGAHRYTVSYHDVLYDSGKDKTYLGQCDDDNCEIHIMHGRAESQVAETFMHEVMHAICLDRDIALVDHDVDQIAVGMLAVMVDNPDLFGDTFLKRWQDESE